MESSFTDRSLSGLVVFMVGFCVGAVVATCLWMVVMQYMVPGR